MNTSVPSFLDHINERKIHFNLVDSSGNDYVDKKLEIKAAKTFKKTTTVVISGYDINIVDDFTSTMTVMLSDNTKIVVKANAGKKPSSTVYTMSVNNAPEIDLPWEDFGEPATGDKTMIGFIMFGYIENF